MHAAMPITGCLQLCMAIRQQLTIAQHNKKECSSLRTVLNCIQDFLEALPVEGLSAGGIKALERIRGTLESSQTCLSKVTKIGLLISLLVANDVRQDIVRFSSDLRTNFELLGVGEKLVRMSEKRMQALESVQGELRRSKFLFIDKEAIGEQLRNTAEAAQQKGMHPQQLQIQLLDQLEQDQEVLSLSPEDILAEIQTLQMEAMFGTDPNGPVKKKLLGDKTEEFLVDQICAACAPKAAKANMPLTSAAAAEPPDGYLCPISKEIMGSPVILAETGQTYDNHNIQQWLQQHSTCPATGATTAASDPAPSKSQHSTSSPPAPTSPSPSPRQATIAVAGAWAGPAPAPATGSPSSAPSIQCTYDAVIQPANLTGDKPKGCLTDDLVMAFAGIGSKCLDSLTLYREAGVGCNGFGIGMRNGTDDDCFVGPIGNGTLIAAEDGGFTVRGVFVFGESFNGTQSADGNTLAMSVPGLNDCELTYALLAANPTP